MKRLLLVALLALAATAGARAQEPPPRHPGPRADEPRGEVHERREHPEDVVVPPGDDHVPRGDRGDGDVADHPGQGPEEHEHPDPRAAGGASSEGEEPSHGSCLRKFS